MRYLPDGAQMQAADKYTIEQLGVPSLVLMERAALKVVEAIHEKGIDTSRTLVVCGSGNNGGDGFAVARLLTEEGMHAEVLFAGGISEPGMLASETDCRTDGDSCIH